MSEQPGQGEPKDPSFHLLKNIDRWKKSRENIKESLEKLNVEELKQRILQLSFEYYYYDSMSRHDNAEGADERRDVVEQEIDECTDEYEKKTGGDSFFDKMDRWGGFSERE